MSPLRSSHRLCCPLTRRNSFPSGRTSLLASLLNLCGYLAFTLLLGQPRHTRPLGLPIQYALSAAYVLIGSGTVASYFCSLKTSSLNFPSHPSIALGVPLAFFGLSGAFLSAVAGGRAFDDGDGELDARKFAAFLTALVSGWNLFAAVGLRIMPSREAEELLREEDALADGAAREHAVVEDEETPLLDRVEEGKDEGVGPLVDLPIGKLLRERSFWVLGAVLFLVIGPVRPPSPTPVLCRQADLATLSPDSPPPRARPR